MHGREASANRVHDTIEEMFEYLEALVVADLLEAEASRRLERLEARHA